MKISIKNLEENIARIKAEQLYNHSEEYDPIFVATNEFAFKLYNEAIQDLKNIVEVDGSFRVRLLDSISELLLNENDFIEEYIGLCIYYVFSESPSYSSLSHFNSNKAFLEKIYYDLFHSDPNFKPELIEDIEYIKSI